MKTILIIEDETDLAELVSFNLEKEGYRPLIATDGPSGLESARHNSPDLILLDLMLPGMSGMEICKALKSRDKTASICNTDLELQRERRRDRPGGRF